MIYINPDAAMIDKRVEIPVHSDQWMRGDRYGRVVHVYRGGKMVRVELDSGYSIRLPLDTLNIEWHLVD